MVDSKFFKGESKTVEFKAKLPDKSETYMKTIIAFANTSGGKLIIDIDDNKSIIGIDKDNIFEIMDKVTNAISDACEPQIVPDISFKTVEDKCILVIEIYPGANRPYYLKSKGKERGTYIRSAATSRLADSDKIRELEMEGKNISWDEQICMGYEVTREAIDKLCSDIQKYMTLSTSEEIKIPTEKQLINWKVLKKVNDKLLATNAFVLLTSDFFQFAKIQCALFKGITRDVFIDKKEYTGSIYEQVEAAYQFVLRHINRSSEIESLIRIDKYELPTSAIREIIINAQVHRNYMDNSCVQIAIYDDRLEVTSPGTLYGGLTLEEILNGRSKIRNKVIAEIFNKMDLIEQWGTGIQRIINRAKEYELPKPEFREIGNTFRVNLYRKADKKLIKADKKPIKEPIKTDKKPIKTDKKPIKADGKSITTSKQRKKFDRENLIIKYVKEYGSISNKEARQILVLAESTTKRFLKEMVKEGLLLEKGERKNRRYILANER